MNHSKPPAFHTAVRQASTFSFHAAVLQGGRGHFEKRVLTGTLAQLRAHVLDGLDVRVVWRDARANEAVRRRKVVDEVDGYLWGRLQEILGCVEAARARADDTYVQGACMPRCTGCRNTKGSAAGQLVHFSASSK